MAFARAGLAMDGAGEYDSCYDNIISNNTIEATGCRAINITSATGNRLYERADGQQRRNVGV